MDTACARQTLQAVKRICESKEHKFRPEKPVFLLCLSRQAVQKAKLLEYNLSPVWQKLPSFKTKRNILFTILLLVFLFCILLEVATCS